MAKLNRVTQKLFGSTAGVDEISVFGSLAASDPAYTTDPAVIQSLSNFLEGWEAALVGFNSPGVEDLNAIDYLWSYQLCYLFQAGIAEYDSGTTYYENSFCQVSGVIYQSLIDSNIGNTPASSPSDWVVFAYPRKTPTAQVLTSTGTTTAYYFYLGTTHAATVGATYTNNGQTFTVVATIASATAVVCTGTGNPSSSGTLTKASGTGDSTLAFTAFIPMATYTTPANATYLKIQMVGGGGGGAAGGTGNNAGGIGTDSVFGNNMLWAQGGFPGQDAFDNSADNGNFTIASPAYGFGMIGQGGSSAPAGPATSLELIAGGTGGNSFFGGAGVPTASPTPTHAALGNSGSGGAGGTVSGSANPGAGGAAGGYINATVPTPAAFYFYAVGTGGNGGSIGSGQQAGGAGAPGIILVEEHYN